VVGIGGKSGVYTLLDAKTGRFLWSSLLVPAAIRVHGVGARRVMADRIYVSITIIPHSVQAHGERRGSRHDVTALLAALDP